MFDDCLCMVQEIVPIRLLLVHSSGCGEAAANPIIMKDFKCLKLNLNF